MGSLDARLRHLIDQHEEPELAEAVGLPHAAPPEARIEFLARCAGPAGVRALRHAGAHIHFTSRRTHVVVTGEASISALAAASAHPAVVRIEASRPMVPDLDLACSDTGAAYLRQEAQPTVRGAGTLVGIVDGGIDFTHPDFRNEDGSSRILKLWDQALPPLPGSVPYGRVYDKAQIDAALAESDPFAKLPHRDRLGHGTHVAGIAAGNGLAGQGRFCGVAPDADLIVVAARTEPDVTLGRSKRALDAILWILTQAAGRPLSINISQGMNGGGHCGETLLETGIDEQLRQPGVVVVKSAGNEQPWRIHAGGTLQQGETVRLRLEVASNDRKNDVLEIWHDDVDEIAIALAAPGSDPLPFVVAGQEAKLQIPSGNEVSIYSESDMDGTGDTLTTLVFSAGTASSFIQPGYWTLLLRGDRVQHGRFDAWIERGPRGLGAEGEQMRFADGYNDDRCTISVPGTARRVITVGSFVTRPGNGSGAAVGKLSAFSSQGPSRYGARKPELVAPGEMVISCRTSQGLLPPDPDDRYTPMPGTSMAAPHVAGAAALVLGERPELTCEQVKQILMRSARRDGPASTAPDDAWGSGKLDARAAVALTSHADFPIISDVRATGTVLVWKTDVPCTCAVLFSTSARRLQLGKQIPSRVTLSPGTTHSVDLKDLDSGTYHCEVVAYSAQNFWTAHDNGGAFHQVVVPRSE